MFIFHSELVKLPFNLLEELINDNILFKNRLFKHFPIFSPLN